MYSSLYCGVSSSWMERQCLAETAKDFSAEKLLFACPHQFAYQ